MVDYSGRSSSAVSESLEVFCVGVFLAVGHVVLVKISDAIWMQIAINTVGIAMLTAVAYCRFWSRKVDKPNSPAVPIRDRMTPGGADRKRRTRRVGRLGSRKACR